MSDSPTPSECKASQVAPVQCEHGRLRRSCEICELLDLGKRLQSCGVIELAVLTENRSLSEYMEHWENRAIKAERELAAKDAELSDLRDDVKRHIEIASFNAEDSLKWRTLFQNERDHMNAAQEEIERLRGELAEAKETITKFGRWQHELMTRAEQAESRAAANEKDAQRFNHLQNLPIVEAQAFFWTYASRKQRAAAIDAAMGDRNA